MLLYAETHYPRHWISRIRKAEPEIVVDLPWRIEPGCDLPILLTVVDAHMFPVEIESLALRVADGSAPPEMTEIRVQQAIGERYWWRLFTVPRPAPEGTIEIVPLIRYRVKGRQREAVADNYRGTSHGPFRVRLAGEGYPVEPGWYAGDAHVHSEFTRDQIEFGPPVAGLAKMAAAMGIRWLALTDHSYDLDDSEDSYLRNDAALPRWERMQRTSEETGEGVCVIPGEEISCGNARGRNVHLLGLGMRTYIAGAGDSAERPLHNRPDHSVAEVTRMVREQGGVALAAHPGFSPPWIQRLIFRRGVWGSEDLEQEGLAGIQAGGNLGDAGFKRGMKEWVRLLLRGKRICLVAGNDSHGAFGRSRQVTVPWWSLGEGSDYLFGDGRTVVRAASLSRNAILEGVSEGRCYVTNGPAISLIARNGEQAAEIGDELPGGTVNIRVCARSTPEWGSIARIGVATGKRDGVETWTWREPDQASLDLRMEMNATVGEGAYFRAEVYTEKGRAAFANPVWITAPVSLDRCA